MVTVDPIYFFVFGALFFLYHSIKKIQEYLKYKENVYAVQALGLFLMGAAIMLMSSPYYIIYGVIVFILAILVSLFARFVLKQDLQKVQDRYQELNKESFFNKLSRNLFDRGLTGQIGYFVLSLFFFTVIFSAFVILFPSLFTNTFQYLLIALFSALLSTKSALDRYNRQKQVEKA
ncbi:MAG: hypothetical protein AABX38_06345 [Candidatus Micrarchaeota archaeon]